MSSPSWLQPSRYLRRFEFLRRCLSQRLDVQRYFDNEEYLQQCLDPNNHAFVLQCFAHRAVLDGFFEKRVNLQKVAVHEGTIVDSSERTVLRDLVALANELPGPIIEFGTLMGFTTCFLAVCARNDKKILTVDNYSWNAFSLSPESHKALTHSFLSYLIDAGQVETFDMTSQAFRDSYTGEPPALVFLDAEHTYDAVKSEIRWARDIGAKLICGHDFGSHCPGIMQAVNEAGGAIRVGGTLWVLETAAYRDQSARPRLARSA